MPEECGYIAGRARLYCWKSAVILPEEHGYIARSARLYCRKSVVILPEERVYIAGRVLLYFCNENSGHLCLCQQPRAAHTLRSDQNCQGIEQWGKSLDLRERNGDHFVLPGPNNCNRTPFYHNIIVGDPCSENHKG